MTRMTTIATITPSIPPRGRLLSRALTSITTQTRAPDQILVAVDHQREGPSVLRNRLAWKAGTEWVAFLDDDDEFLPQHLQQLLEHGEQTGADLVYPWFVLQVNGREDNSRDPLHVPVSEDGGSGPLVRAEGRPFDHWTEWGIRNGLNVIPVTVLVRRELFMDVGGFPKVNSPEWPRKDCEDMGCWIRLLDAGAKISHLNERTWRWHHHGRNTSGKTNSW
jgi:glycosyltransferase involved in cell wall biosynthesis